MSVSMKDVDPAFQGAGQKAYPISSGIEIWQIETSHPVTVPNSSHGKFFTGDSYVILKTTALKNGVLRHDIHYWIGKNANQDGAQTAAIKTIELDAALGGRAVQYRELQGHETEKFLSYFKPCIIPQEGGVASGLKHAETDEHQTRLYICKGKHAVQVKEVPFVRSSLNHEDIFILDTKSKIFQFSGSNSSIQERAKALDVVQYINDTFHDGKCEIAAIEDGRLMADVETGEFWGFFGGSAPLPKKTTTDEAKSTDSLSFKIFCVEKGEAVPLEVDSWTRELLDTHKCYILDCGMEVFIWMGRNTSLNQRKAASSTADEVLRSQDRSKPHVIRVIEGFETVIFRSKFDFWPQSTNVTVTEEGRGKVAEVWRVCLNGQQRSLLQVSEQSKFYSGDCYIFQYSYPGEEKDEHLIGTWFGNQSVEEDRVAAVSQASKMVESLKFVPTQGGLSEGYKNYIAKMELQDDTYSEDGLALFRVQGSGPENMQAIQVDPVASSLNSSYCYILHSGSTVFTWSGNLTTSEAQELAERQLDLIKPNLQSKLQKEGAESEQFWDLLGGKSEYPSQKIARKSESDPHLFSCTLTNARDLKVTEVHNFNQDDLMTEDILILDCQSDIYVWVGRNLESKTKMNALNIGEKFLERDFSHEKLSPRTPIYIVMEGGEPTFFTRFFSWDSTRSAMHGNSFQRKLAILKHGGTLPVVDKPKRRKPVSHTGRSAVPDKSQRSRSMSFSPDRVRVRGRSPAFNALAATFENPNARNLSTPPPVVSKIYPKSVTPDSGKLPSRSAAIAALTSTFEQPSPPARKLIIPRSPKVSPEIPRPKSETVSMQKSEEPKPPKPQPIQEDVKENEAADDEGLPVYPYDRLITTSTDPVAEINVAKRETYLSSTEFKEKFGMVKDTFYKLPKWKQNKLKMSLQLF
ncbi:Villin-4 [Orobanche hederae]